MKKRILTAVLALCCLLGCAACSESGAEDEKLTVICTVFPPYDFVRTIAPDAAVSMLLPPGQESHSYEPTPRDIVDIQNCDLFVYVGGESEAWVEDMLASMDSPPRTLTLLDCVGVAGEDVHQHDEHVWTSPKNAVKIVEALEAALCEMGVADEEALHDATDRYVNELAALDESFAKTVQDAARNTLVFADRFPFRHFAETYGLTCQSAYEGCDHSAEPSAATVATLCNFVRSENIPVVLYIEFSNQKLADTVCEATKAEKRLFHSCHNLTKEELQNGETYVSLMKKNLAVLKEALS